VLRYVKPSTDPALLVGLESPDDAAVYRLSSETALVQTADFFTPVVDDPRSWGRIAAANALSDIYAMGARPVTALNLVGWPRELDFSLLGEVLEGAGEACGQAGVSIVGGHSVDDPEPKFGLAVTGVVHPEHIVRNTGAPPGCDLVLTKPLGMGIASSAIKEGRADPATIAEATRIMSTLNRAASEAMLASGVAAATDVTGFGLIGHLLEMLESRLDAELSFPEIPVLPKAFELARAGVLPAGSRRNIEAARPQVELDGVDETDAAVLFDAQTSGGLLMAIPHGRSPRLRAELRARGAEWYARIGSLVEGRGRIHVRRA
jgi:selenide,water dikinase